MAGAKEELDRRDNLRALAEGVAEEAGAVSRCEHHIDIILTNDDREAESRAYAIGTKMVKGGEVACARTEFMDAIKDVINEASNECGSCANWRDG